MPCAVSHFIYPLLFRQCTSRQKIISNYWQFSMRHLRTVSNRFGFNQNMNNFKSSSLLLMTCKLLFSLKMAYVNAMHELEWNRSLPSLVNSVKITERPCEWLQKKWGVWIAFIPFNNKNKSNGILNVVRKLQKFGCTKYDWCYSQIKSELKLLSSRHYSKHGFLSDFKKADFQNDTMRSG